MPVALRTLEILAIFVAAGLPVNLALRPTSFGGVDARILLAPTSGLAVVTIYAFMFLGVGQPIRDGVGPFWVVLVAAWVAVLVRYGRKALPHLSSRVTVGKVALPAGLLVACLIAASFFLAPFLRSPNLVFWHYSGSDGYFYMRVSEWLESHGRWELPQVGPYDGASGFLAEDLRLFDLPRQGDKPGTFGLLAGISALLGLLPHEVYSPLVAAVEVTLFGSLTWFGLSVGVSRRTLPLFALAGSLAMVVWYFGDNTFLGNMLTLPLVPAVLGLVDVGLTWGTGFYGGLLLGAMMVIFPTGPLAVVALGLPSLCLVFVRAARQRRLLRVGGAVAVWLGTMLVVMAPMFLYLVSSANILTFLNLVPLPGLYGRAPRAAGVHWGQFLQHPNWLWPALNLNVIPAEPLRPDEPPFLVLLIVLYAVCLAIAIRLRQGRLFLFGLGFAAMLLIGTLSGMVTDDYNLYRAGALFWFIPVTLLFVGLSQAVRRLGPKPRLGYSVLAMAVIVLLARFARNDYRQFDFSWREHLSDAQYSQQDIDDRKAITDLVGNRTITLASDIPTFTSFANVLMLFSSVHLGAPNYFYQFLFFFPISPPKDVPYTSDLVLRSLRYTDVWEPPPDRTRIYRSGNYEVLQNDLIPFFDDDTLPIQNGLPAAYLRAHELAISREFSLQTPINFYSRQEHDVRFGFQFASQKHPQALWFALDNGGLEHVPVSSAGAASLPALRVAPGLHKLTLAAPDKVSELDAVTLE